MMTVKRTTFKDLRNTKNKEIPAEYFECRYYHGGRQIAWYSSIDDVLRLKTDYIGSNFDKTPYERALECDMKRVYEYLFEMLNVDEKTNVSEYTSA